jgi:hypothetical protein
MFASHARGERRQARAQRRAAKQSLPAAAASVAAAAAVGAAAGAEQQAAEELGSSSDTSSSSVESPTYDWDHVTRVRLEIGQRGCLSGTVGLHFISLQLEQPWRGS